MNQYKVLLGVPLNDVFSQQLRCSMNFEIVNQLEEVLEKISESNHETYSSGSENPVVLILQERKKEIK